MAEYPAELRARINHYRQMQRQVDDPQLREALEQLIGLTLEKLGSGDAKP